MKRELNPNLFQSESASPGAVPTSTTESMATQAPRQDYNRVASVEYADLQIIAAQLDGLKKTIKQVVSQVQKQDSLITEMLGGNQLKFEKFKQAFHRVEEFVKNNVGEVRGQMGKLNSKLVANNLSETKVEHLIQRQNEIVMSFESKLSQTQRVISEQNMQLMNYKTALDEARQEIARLKRF